MTYSHTDLNWKEKQYKVVKNKNMFNSKPVIINIPIITIKGNKK